MVIKMNVPKLRFKQFNDEWKKEKFYSCVSMTNGQVNPKDPKYCNLPHIGPGNIEKKTGRLLDYNLAIDDKLISNKYLFDEKDIIYSKINPHFAKVCYPKLIGLCSADAYPIKPKDNKLISGFLLYLLLNPKFTKFATSVSMRTGMPKINRDELGLYNFNIPSIKEQVKISNFFQLLDKKIELQSKKIEALKLYKTCIINNVFIKFNLQNNKVKLESLLTEITEKSKINNEYKILSSTTKGIFLQSEYFNKQAASENTIGYKILRKNQLVLSPQNLWMGNININMSFDIGIVSPSYKIFNINEKIIDINILNEWIKSPRTLYQFLIASEQGASIVRRNLNINLFKEITINIPKLSVQRKYGKLFKIINNKVFWEEEKLFNLQQIKKGLMQNMFI